MAFKSLGTVACWLALSCQGTKGAAQKVVFIAMDAKWGMNLWITLISYGFALQVPSLDCFQQLALGEVDSSETDEDLAMFSLLLSQHDQDMYGRAPGYSVEEDVAQQDQDPCVSNQVGFGVELCVFRHFSYKVVLGTHTCCDTFKDLEGGESFIGSRMSCYITEHSIVSVWDPPAHMFGIPSRSGCELLSVLRINANCYPGFGGNTRWQCFQLRADMSDDSGAYRCMYYSLSRFLHRVIRWWRYLSASGVRPARAFPYGQLPIWRTTLIAQIQQHLLPLLTVAQSLNGIQMRRPELMAAWVIQPVALRKLPASPFKWPTTASASGSKCNSCC